MTLFPRRLQSRTATVIALTFFVFLSLFFITTYWSIRGSLIARSDGEVKLELESIASQLRPGMPQDSIARLFSEHRAIGESQLHYLVLEKQGNNYMPRSPASGETMPADIAAELEEHPQQPLTFSTAGGNMRLLSIARPGLILGAAYNTIVIEEAEDSIIHVFDWYLAAGLLVGILGGIFLSRYLIGPIGTLAHSARKLLNRADETQARLPVSKAILEVADLARSINALLDARERALEQQRNFAADAAHELRTPLTILKGEIEVELRVTDPESGHAELLRSNLEEIERLISTVQDLLELADIEAESRQDTDSSECSLLEAIRYAADRLYSFATERGVSIVLPKQDVIIRAQERRITRMVYNLLLNAIQNSSAGSNVIIRIKVMSNEYVLEIEDHGVGIPTERIERLFERFYRAANKGQHGGAGLGLAIVKSIADHYGLTLNVKSVEHAGTTVFLNIPLSLAISTSSPIR